MADEDLQQPDDQRPLTPLGTYSYAADLARKALQAKGSPQQYKATLLKQGVKPDEFKHSNYDAKFAGRPSVTRQELAQHFDRNLPPVQETTLGQNPKNSARENLLFDAQDRPIGGYDRAAALNLPPTKFHTYTLPGGTNYRETLLHLPEHSPEMDAAHAKYEKLYNATQDAARRSQAMQRRLGLDHPDTDAARATHSALSQEFRAHSDEYKRMQEAAGKPYQSSHWDTPNVLAHLRMSDREGPPVTSDEPANPGNTEVWQGGRWVKAPPALNKGKRPSKILHLEELQSDWAQEGRKKGFKEGDPDKRMDELQAELMRRHPLLDTLNPESWDKAWKANPDLHAENERLLQARNGVPKAPYIDSTQKWVDLGLKRALYEAAKGGYDKLVMTPGEEQAKRYDLSKHIKQVSAMKSPDPTATHPYHVHALSRTGDTVLSKHHTAEELPNVIGKDLAERIVKETSAIPDKQHHYRGLDLKVGGEGMKAFYDQMLPQALEKLAKRHDPEAKVQLHGHGIYKPSKQSEEHWDRAQRESGLDAYDWNRLPMEERRARLNRTPKPVLPEHKLHALDITPRMRASILKGQPAYATGGSVPDPAVAMPPTDVGMGHNGGPLLEPDGAPVTPAHGGLAFPPAEGDERLRMRAKRAASGKPVGAPGNPRTVIKAPKAAKGEKQLPDFVTGNINFEDWRRRHEQILEPHEIHEAGKWYGKIDDMFRRYYPDDPALAKKHRNAWLVAQQNISPPGAMNNVLMQQEQMNRGVPKELWTAGGMPNPTAAARSVLQDQPIEGGVGQKISDFVDSAEGKPVRSWMNNHTNGGSPFVVDVHTARDTGMVDEELLNHLKRLKYAVPEGLKKDLGTSPGAPQYENRADWGRDLTHHLNAMKWQGRDNWTPAEIQAIGWMGMTKLTRNKEEGAEEGLERNLRRISTELSPGEGSPWQQKYGAAFDALPEEHKYGLTKKLTNAAMRHAQDLAGINMHSMVHGTGDWEGNQKPSAVGQALATKQGADIAANALGYLLNQTEVWHNRVKPPTKNPSGFAIDMVEHGDTDHLHDPKNLQDLWAKVQEADKSGLIKGYQPIVTPSGGKKGIRVLIDKGGAGTLTKLDTALKKGGELDALLSSLPYDVRSELHEAEITKARNDWKEHPRGQAYIRGLEQTLGRNPAADLDRARSQLEKELEKHLDEAHAKAGTSWRTQKADGGSVGSADHIVDALKGWLKEERVNGGRIAAMREQSGDLTETQKRHPPDGDELVERALALAQSDRQERKNGGAVEEAPIVASIKSDIDKLATVIAAQNTQIDKLTRLLSAPQIVERDENNRIKKIYRDVT